MRGGKLKRSVDIESPPNPLNTDAAGEPIKTWTPFLQGIMVAIEPLFGRELLAAQQKYNTVSHKITMRYVAGVTAKMRVKFGTRYFNILSIYTEEEDGRVSHLLCEEGLVNG
jgi:SPP1 family predicted phage head-tail adaptor